jgi:hypothetical protein
MTLGTFSALLIRDLIDGLAATIVMSRIMEVQSGKTQVLCVSKSERGKRSANSLEMPSKLTELVLPVRDNADAEKFVVQRRG